MNDDLERALDNGVQIKMPLRHIEYLINAWNRYDCPDRNVKRSIAGKLERAQAKASRALQSAELAHDTMRQVEINKGWRMEDDLGFMPKDVGDEPDFTP